MNDWRCTVKTPSNFLQTVYVEAYTRDDAVAAAEHSTGGKCIMATPEYDISSSHDEDNSSSGGGEIDGGFVLLALGAFLLIAAWKYVLVISVIGLGIWLLLNNKN